VASPAAAGYQTTVLSGRWPVFLPVAAARIDELTRFESDRRRIRRPCRPRSSERAGEEQQQATKARCHERFLERLSVMQLPAGEF
jgi:hypothetical protein